MTINKNMTIDNSEGVSDRLAFIDFKLRFTGFVTRLDLKEAFGIAEAAASRALTEYNVRRPRNKTQKTNTIIRDSFEPLIKISGEVALEMLANGFNKNKLTNDQLLTYEKIGVIPNYLDTLEIAKITRAIAGGYAISCKYLSESSENYQRRTLLPLAIMYDGSHWMFRAHYREEDSFKNYNFARTVDVKEYYEDKNFKRLSKEELSQDKGWNLRIPLILKVNPELSTNDILKVKTDFGISNNSDELIIYEREAFIWIVKKKWCIDDRSDEEKIIDKVNNVKKHFKFELQNQDMINKLTV